MKKILLSLSLLAALSANAQETSVVTFEAAELAEDGTLKGASYEENGFVFDNYYSNEGWEYNSGYTVSNNTDRNVYGPDNQYSVDARGGADGSKNFLVYNPCFYENCYIHRADNSDFMPTSVAVALTTYTSLSTQDGDAYSKKFGVDDFYTMIVKGLDAEGEVIGILEIDLIDYPRSWMPWAEVDLASLGKVNSLLIDFTSSDYSWGYMNTPAYVALDNFTATVSSSTAISSVNLPATKTSAHNLAGQKVSNLTPGVYIIAGQKVVVK